MTTQPQPNPAAILRPVVDCLVVGGGPVGLLTAVFLGQAGLQVSVVERWPQRYPLPRACTIDHEALRILQAAGLMADHAHLFEPSEGERGGYEFRNGAGELLQAIDWNRAAESGWANTNGFYQPDLEATLEDLAVATPGLSVHRGWTFQALTEDHRGVSVQVGSTEQPAEVVQIRSRWLIGADGANSPVRSQLGIDVGDSGFQADWLVVDYQPLVEEKWSAFVTQYCDPAQPTTAVNSGPGRRRFEFMRRADMTVEELGQDSTAWRLMAPWGVTPETARLERHAVTRSGDGGHTPGAQETSSSPVTRPTSCLPSSGRDCAPACGTLGHWPGGWPWCTGGLRRRRCSTRMSRNAPDTSGRSSTRQWPPALSSANSTSTGQQPGTPR